MKSIASVLSIIALGFGLLGCSRQWGRWRWEQYLSLCGVDDRSRFRCGRQSLYFDPRGYRRNGSVHLDAIGRCLADWLILSMQPRVS